jgi:hypothetical protein
VSTPAGLLLLMRVVAGAGTTGWNEPVSCARAGKASNNSNIQTVGIKLDSRGMTSRYR